DDYVRGDDQMRFILGSIQNGSCKCPAKRYSVVFTHGESDAVAVANRGAGIPTAVVKVFLVVEVYDAGGHDTAIIETTQVAKIEDWPVVRIQDLARIVSIHFYERGERTIKLVA